MNFTSVCGIIAEFNPLHKGHKLIIEKAKESADTLVCAIGGNFTQRGDVAVISKQKRAEFALISGADMVVEIPVLWSMSTAQNFALGGVSQLISAGCDEIIFGSESGDIELLKKTADILLCDAFKENLEKELASGITFASARTNAAEKCGADPKILENPNDNLGIEYILAALRLNSDISFRCIKREGAAHDSTDSSGDFVSASLIRQYLTDGKIGFCERFMPPELRGLLNENMIADIRRIETALLAILRQKGAEDFKNLPDISEGIENKLYFSVRKATDLDGLFGMIKTKRYTLARVRRLVLSAALNLPDDFFLKVPPYTRVLGFNKNGAVLIGKDTALSPLITRVSDIKLLGDSAQAVFDTESRATDLWSLALKSPLECGSEFQMKIIKTE